MAPSFIFFLVLPKILQMGVQNEEQVTPCHQRTNFIHESKQAFFCECNPSLTDK